MLSSITCVGFTFQILQTSLPKVIDIRLTDLLSLDPAKIGLVVSSIYVISGLMNYVGGIAADRYSVKFIYAYGMLVQGILLFAFAGMEIFINYFKQYYYECPPACLCLALQVGPYRVPEI